MNASVALTKANVVFSGLSRSRQPKNVVRKKVATPAAVSLPLWSSDTRPETFPAVALVLVRATKSEVLNTLVLSVSVRSRKNSRSTTRRRLTVLIRNLRPCSPSILKRKAYRLPFRMQQRVTLGDSDPSVLRGGALQLFVTLQPGPTDRL
jgi:hypothetical protein